MMAISVVPRVAVDVFLAGLEIQILLAHDYGHDVFIGDQRRGSSATLRARARGFH